MIRMYLLNKGTEQTPWCLKGGLGGTEQTPWYREGGLNVTEQTPWYREGGLDEPIPYHWVYIYRQ